MAIYTDIYGESKDKAQYAGCVLWWYEMNSYNDSDWYAEVWDEESKSVKTVEFDTTRCGGSGHCEIDATAEVLRKVYRYHYENERRRFDTYINPDQAKVIRKGDKVRVIKGRKVPKGTEGIVFWVGEVYNQFSNRDETRVGIEVDGNSVFVSADYVEAVDWESRLMHGKERKDAIRELTLMAMPSYSRSLLRHWGNTDKRLEYRQDRLPVYRG